MLELQPRQKKFADEWIKTNDIAGSYFAAGYKPKTKQYAQTAGNRLLHKEHVQAYIAEMTYEAEELNHTDTIAGATEVMEILTAAARGEMMEEKALVVSTGDFMSKVAKEEVRIQPKDRIKAAEALAKRYGLDQKVSNHAEEQKALDTLVKAMTAAAKGLARG